MRSRCEMWTQTRTCARENSTGAQACALSREAGAEGAALPAGALSSGFWAQEWGKPTSVYTNPPVLCSGRPGRRPRALLTAQHPVFDDNPST